MRIRVNSGVSRAVLSVLTATIPLLTGCWDYAAHGDSQTDFVNWKSQVAVGSDHLPVVVYIANTGSGHVVKFDKYTPPPTNTWAGPVTIDSTPPPPGWTYFHEESLDLAATATDYHVLRVFACTKLNANNQLDVLRLMYYTKRQNGVWSTPALIAIASSPSEDAHNIHSIAPAHIACIPNSPGSNPYIAFRELVYNQDPGVPHVTHHHDKLWFGMPTSLGIIAQEDGNLPSEENLALGTPHICVNSSSNPVIAYSVSHFIQDSQGDVTQTFEYDLRVGANVGAWQYDYLTPPDSSVVDLTTYGNYPQLVGGGGNNYWWTEKISSTMWRSFASIPQTDPYVINGMVSKPSNGDIAVAGNVALHDFPWGNQVNRVWQVEQSIATSNIYGDGKADMAIDPSNSRVWAVWTGSYQNSPYLVLSYYDWI